MQIIDGAPRKIEVRGGKGGEGIPAKHARIIRTLIPIRDAIREVLRAQEANEPWGPAQTRLRIAYNSFLRNFGAINLTTISETTDPKTGEARETQRRPNLQPFLDDPDVWLVASIEDYDVETGEAKKGPIFSERVLHPPATPTIESAADALAVTLHEIGHVDIDRIAELLGRSRDDTRIFSSRHCDAAEAIAESVVSMHQAVERAFHRARELHVASSLARVMRAAVGIATARLIVIENDGLCMRHVDAAAELIEPLRDRADLRGESVRFCVVDEGPKIKQRLVRIENTRPDRLADSQLTDPHGIAVDRVEIIIGHEIHEAHALARRGRGDFGRIEPFEPS
jgi:hypothetical protein